MKISDNSSIKPTLGFFYSITITLDDDKTFIFIPKYYPENYYPPNAIRIGIFSGVKYNNIIHYNKIIKSYDLYVNSVTNDLYLQYFFKTSQVGFFNIFTLALGINLNVN